MGAYATVTWPPGSEVTSQKLAQMAANEDNLKENSLVGDLHYQPSNTGAAPAGREPGLVRAQRVCGIRIDFDSQVPVASHGVRVQLGALGFTEAPIIANSYNVGNSFCVAHLAIADRLDYCEFYIVQKDSLVVQIFGTLHLVLIGR